MKDNNKKTLNSCSSVAQTTTKNPPSYKAAFQGRDSFTRGEEEAWSLLVSSRIDCCAFQDVSFHALRWESLWRTRSCAIAAWISPPQESRSHSLTFPNCRGSCRSPQKRRESPLSDLWRQQQGLFSLLSKSLTTFLSYKAIVPLYPICANREIQSLDYGSSGVCASRHVTLQTGERSRNFSQVFQKLISLSMPILRATEGKNCSEQ